MVATISQRRRLVAAIALALAAAAVVSCGGGSSNTKPTPTKVTLATVPLTATAAPQRTLVPSGISGLTFIDRLHGWAFANCIDLSEVTECDIVGTEDGGRTWRHEHRVVGEMASFQALDAQNVFAVGTAHDRHGLVLYATTDAGATWTTRNLEDRLDIRSAYFVSPGVGFAVSSGVIMKTADGGQSWHFNFGSPDCDFAAITFSAVTQGWATGGGAQGPCLFRSTNGGVTWTASFLGASSPSVAQAFADFLPKTSASEDLLSHVKDECRGDTIQFVSQTDAWLHIECRGYFSGGFLVLRTTNAGQTWSEAWGTTECLMGCQVITGGEQPVFFLDSLHAWRQGPKVIEASEDGGKTWTRGKEVKGCCNGSRSAFFTSPKLGLAPSEQPGTLQITTDGGLTWRTQPVTIVP